MFALIGGFLRLSATHATWLDSHHPEIQRLAILSLAARCEVLLR